MENGRVSYQQLLESIEVTADQRPETILQAVLALTPSTQLETSLWFTVLDHEAQHKLDNHQHDHLFMRDLAAQATQKAPNAELRWKANSPMSLALQGLSR